MARAFSAGSVEWHVTLPRAILTSELESEQGARRGRPVKRDLAAPSSAAACMVPGALFDAIEITRMRKEYSAASQRLGLEAKPRLAREVAIAILRSAAARS